MICSVVRGIFSSSSLVLQHRLQPQDRAEDVERLGLVRVVGAELVGEQLRGGQGAGEPGLLSPPRVVGHPPVSGDDQQHGDRGPELHGPEAELVGPPGAPAQVAHRHVHGSRGEQSEQDAHQHLDDQPGDDPGQLGGEVGLEAGDERGHVAVRRPRQVEDVDVLRADVGTDRQAARGRGTPSCPGSCPPRGPAAPARCPPRRRGCPARWRGRAARAAGPPRPRSGSASRSAQRSSPRTKTTMRCAACRAACSARGPERCPGLPGRRPVGGIRRPGRPGRHRRRGSCSHLDRGAAGRASRHREP